MKIIRKTLVNLSNAKHPDRLGHISEYELRNGNRYFVYFLEMRYFGLKEFSLSGKLIQEESSEEHHYSLDFMFEDKSRHLGWNF